MMEMEPELEERYRKILERTGCTTIIIEEERIISLPVFSCSKREHSPIYIEISDPLQTFYFTAMGSSFDS